MLGDIESPHIFENNMAWLAVELTARKIVMERENK